MKQRLSAVREISLAGFSMIEVIIALMVIGTLLILILNSLQAVQAKSRDTTRRSDIDNIAQKLEACYSDTKKCNDTYPSIIQLTDTSPSGWATTNLIGLDDGWLYDSSHGIIQSDAASAATQYEYTTTPSSCTGTQGDTPCKGFTLEAYQETNPSHPYVKESINK